MENILDKHNLHIRIHGASNKLNMNCARVDMDY
jgi:hypothetical protein